MVFSISPNGSDVKVFGGYWRRQFYTADRSANWVLPLRGFPMSTADILGAVPNEYRA